MCCQVPWLVEEGTPSALVWGGNVEFVVANPFFSEVVQQDLAQERCFAVPRWDNPGTHGRQKVVVAANLFLREEALLLCHL